MTPTCPDGQNLLEQELDDDNEGNRVVDSDARATHMRQRDTLLSMDDDALAGCFKTIVCNAIYMLALPLFYFD